MIKNVEPGERENVSKLFSHAITRMVVSGIFQWDEIYPDDKTLSDDLRNNEMHGFYQDDMLCGVIVLNEVQLKPYADVNWSMEDPRPLVVHRLCIHPDFQNRGIAHALMKFAESYARRNGYRSIRLDAFSKQSGRSSTLSTAWLHAPRINPTQKGDILLL